MLAHQLHESERLLVRLLQVNHLLPVEQILGCVEKLQRLREDGIATNLGLVIKEEDILPRARLLAVARAVKFNLRRNRDKRLAKRLVDDRILEKDAVERSLARQIQTWSSDFRTRTLAELLTEDGHVTSEILLAYITGDRSPAHAADSPPPGLEIDETANPLLVLDIEGDTGLPEEALTDSDLIPPDDDGSPPPEGS